MADVENLIERLYKISDFYEGASLCFGIDRSKLLIEAIQTIRELQEHNKWHIVADGDLPTDEEQEYILCVNGKDRNITYQNAIVTDGSYENGKFYIRGCYCPDVNVIAWRELPKFEEVE